MLDRVQASLPALPPAERRVGKLLISDPGWFAQVSISDIADRAYVSKPTVVRFCRSVGYGGLSDFKHKLADCVNQGVPYIHRCVDANDHMDELMVKVLDNATATFLRYRHSAPTDALVRAADLLEAAWRGRHRIECFGVGNSGIVAQDAQHKLFRLGLNTIAYCDGHVQLMSAALRQPGDVVVAISNSGRSRDLVDAIDIARQRGALTIAITASGSPLASMADVHLAADHPEHYDRYSPMASRLLHLLVVDILATAVALRIGPDTLQPQLRDMKALLQSRRCS